MKKIVFLAAFAFAAQPAFAQVPPSGGSILQQVPAAPLQRPPPDVRIEQGAQPPAPLADGVRIRVDALLVSGQTVYSEAELLALTGFTPGSELSLTELRAMAAKIADYYHRNGYIVAQAYLPAQDIKAGRVTIAVIEGRYGKIELRNSSRLSGQSRQRPARRPQYRRHDHHRPARRAPAAAVGRSRRRGQVDPRSGCVGGHLRPDRRCGAGTPGHRQRRGRQPRQPLHRRIPPGRNGEHQQSRRPGRRPVLSRAGRPRPDLRPHLVPGAVRQGDGRGSVHGARVPARPRVCKPRGARHRADRKHLRQLSADPLAQHQPLRAGRVRRQDFPGQDRPDQLRSPTRRSGLRRWVSPATIATDSAAGVSAPFR